MKAGDVIQSIRNQFSTLSGASVLGRSRIGVFRAIIALLLGFSWVTTSHANPDPYAPAYEVESFDSRITIHENSGVDFEETFVVRFGRASDVIGRELSALMEDSRGDYSRAAIYDVEAFDGAGRPLETSLYRTSSKVAIKIVRRNESIGSREVYRLCYKMHNAIAFPGNRSELNLDINGLAWRPEITKAQATVKFVTSRIPVQVEAECYTGSLGYRTSDCLASILGDSVVITATRTLRGFEGLATRISWESGIVAKPGLWKRLYWEYELDSNWLWIFSIAPLFYIYVRIRRDRRLLHDSVHGSALTAPMTFDRQRLAPAEMALLYVEQFGERDVAASLFDLAARGHIEIRVTGERTSIDFLVSQRFTSGDELSPFEVSLLADLKSAAADGGSLISDFGEQLPDLMQKYRHLVETSLIKRGYLIASPGRARARWVATALVFGALVIALGFPFTNLNWPLVVVSAIVPTLTVGVFGMVISNKTELGIKAFHAITRFRESLKSHFDQNGPDATDGDFGSLIGYVVALDVSENLVRVRKKPAQIELAWMTFENRASFSSALIHDLGNWCVWRLEGFIPTSKEVDSSSDIVDGATGHYTDVSDVEDTAESGSDNS